MTTVTSVERASPAPDRVGAAASDGGAVVSVVIPHVDRWETLRATVDGVESVLADHGWRAQIVVACDASPDESWSCVVELASTRPAVEAVRLDRRSGALNARAVGMLVAEGDVVAMVDDDLDVDPSAIAPLIEAVLSGASLASAVRGGQDVRPTARRAGTAILGALAATLPGRPHDVSSGTKAMSATHARAVLSAWPQVRDLRFGMRLYQVAERLEEVRVDRRLPTAPSNHHPAMLAVAIVDAALMFLGPSRWGRGIAIPIAVAAGVLRATSDRLLGGVALQVTNRVLELCVGLVLVDLALGARSPVPGLVEWTDGSSRQVVGRGELGRLASGRCRARIEV